MQVFKLAGIKVALRGKPAFVLAGWPDGPRVVKTSALQHPPKRAPPAIREKNLLPRRKRALRKPVARVIAVGQIDE